MRSAWMAMVVMLVACGGEAALGEECDEPGGEEGVCEAGSVCGRHSDSSDTPQCLKVCVDDNDCASAESCNGVEGTSTKACRLK